MDKLHVVVGAGGLGLSVAADLIPRGERVRVVSRSGSHGVSGAETVGADATNPADLDVALAGASVVYQCAQPEYTRWAEEFPQLQQGILDATVRAGADLVIADNLYMYGDPDGAVITESSAENPVTKKGRVRKAMADAALDAHRAGRLRVAISRPADYFGPGHDQSSEAIFGAAAAGKRMQFFGRMDVAHSLSYVPDAAAAMATLGTSDAGWGSVWIAPVQPPITQQELSERAWKAAGNTGSPKVTVIGRASLRVIGLVVPVVREFAEMAYLFDKPFVVDSSRFESTFGVSATPNDAAIAATIEHYRGTR
ncbi:MAG: NAD-dependent epimerase/dehydratase family protein [Rhodoglobus sp.]